MKAESTINRQIRELRKLIDDPTSDVIEHRIAYVVEEALRWVLDKGPNGSLAEEVKDNARILFHDMVNPRGSKVAS